MKRSKTADEFYEEATLWRAELRRLRKILRSTVLTEEIKWGAPCYTLEGKHVVGVGAFKSYFGLWFFQGALLKDPARVLVNAQEGRTKALRQWRMHSADEVDAAGVKRYVDEAISLARAGKAIPRSAPKPLVVPVELKRALAADRKLNAAFKALSPGRQREYVEHISEARQIATRDRRLRKVTPMIAAGVGLNEKYRPKP